MTPQQCADDFMAASDAIYTECSRGIADLDRLIVATPSHLSGIARTALVPSLYAYWERFFRQVLGDFLRCVSLPALPLRERNRRLGKLRIKREVRERAHTPERLLDIIERRDLPDARTTIIEARDALQAVEALCDTPLQFINPETWLALDANIRFEVIKKNFDRLGLDADKLKGELLGSGFALFPTLKDMVDTRNDIAHGTTIHATPPERWESLRTFTLALMNSFQLHLYESLRSDAYMLS